MAVAGSCKIGAYLIVRGEHVAPEFALRPGGCAFGSGDPALGVPPAISPSPWAAPCKAACECSCTLGYWVATPKVWLG